MKVHFRMFLLSWLAIWHVPVAWAACEAGLTPAPSVSVTYSGPAETGYGVLSATYSFPNTNDPSQRQLTLLLDGNTSGSIGAAQSGGVWVFELNTSCWPTGTHTLAVKATSCGNPDLSNTGSTSVTINTKPNVSISYSHDAEGLGLLKVPYEFPNTSSSSQRQLNLRVDGAHWTTVGAPAVSGEWEIPFNVTCWNGTHELEIIAHACGNTSEGYSDSDTTSVTVDSKPTASLSFSEDDGGVASVEYEFPNTASAPQRILTLYIDGGYWGTHAASSQNGRWEPTVGVCWETLRVVATACGQGGNPDYVAEDELEATEKENDAISVALLNIGLDDGEPEIQATITWHHVTLNGQISVKQQAWTDGNGDAYAESDLVAPFAATSTSGSRVVTFTPSANTRQVKVIATAPTSCGLAKDDASIDCPSCEATGNPVFWSDGNMRLTDGEPLPPIAGHGLVRTYDSGEQVGGLFGRGWTSLFESRLIEYPDGAVSIVTATNEVVTFRPVGGGFRQSWPRAVRTVGTLPA